MHKLFDSKNILITGGLGMIGSNLARCLVKLGANIIVLDNMAAKHGANSFNISGIEKNIETVIADMGDMSNTLELVRGQDYIFNLAGQSSHIYSMENPLSDLDSNVRAQLVLLEACKKNNRQAKILFSSTRQIYGIPESLPVCEEHNIAPIDFNGHHKLTAESYHTMYYKMHGIRSTILRLTNTYGNGMRIKDDLQNFLGIWIKKVLHNDVIQIFGDGNQIREFNHVDDVIQALLMCAVNESCNGKIYNLGGRNHYTLTEVASLLVTLADAGQIEYVPFPKDREIINIGSYYSDTQKIKFDLNWVPEISLRQGLSDIIQFYQKNIKHYCK